MVNLFHVERLSLAVPETRVQNALPIDRTAQTIDFIACYLAESGFEQVSAHVGGSNGCSPERLSREVQNGTD